MAGAGDDVGVNYRSKQGTSGKSINTLELNKEVHKFTWQIKDFLSMWKIATDTMSFDKILFKFEMGNTLNLPTEIALRLFVPGFDEDRDDGGEDGGDDGEDDGGDDGGDVSDSDTEDTNVRKDIVTFYISPFRSLQRRTFIKFCLRILRSDGTTFKKFRIKHPRDIGGHNNNSFCHFRKIIEISELKDRKNKLLDATDGSLNLEIEITLYSNQSREYRKRTYDEMELQKQSSECLSKAFESMSKNQKYTDAVLVTKDGRILKVHKNVLAARSAVFETMFETNMAENITGVVKIDDCSYEALEIILKYIYTGKLDKKWVEYMVEVVNAADKYDLPLIKEIGDAELIKNVTKENALEMHKFAQLHDLKTAIADLTEYIRINIVSILTPTEAPNTKRK